MLKLPDQGYTPANYAKLVELTELSNVDFCERFNIPKGTFEKHKAGKRTMKWQEWQELLTHVKTYIKDNNMTTLIKNYSTIGLIGAHNGLKRPTMVRIEFDVYGDDDVRVYAVSANNLGKIKSISGVTITRQQLSDLPDDPYDYSVFAKAAFDLLDIEYS